MLDRGNRKMRAFGMRRAQDRPDLHAGDAGPEIRGWTAPARPAGPLVWALRTAALAGVAAIGATQYLAQVSGPGEVAATRVAQAGRPLPMDPETTGSIGRAAQSTRLDPCASTLARCSVPTACGRDGLCMELRLRGLRD